MRGSRNLVALRMVSEIHSARVAAARLNLVGGEEALRSAGRRTLEGEAARDSALALWGDALAQARPDPTHLTRAGDWLDDREVRLKAAALDEAIAERRRDDLAEDLAAAIALEEVATQLAARLRRQANRAREEARLHASGERFLARRSPWRQP